VFGVSSSIDASFAPARLASAKELQAAVLRARWPLDADVVLVSVDSGLSRQDLYQVYYSASYALYPRRVWLANGPGDIARRNAHHVLLLGSDGSFPAAHRFQLSPVLSLVQLP
jgi:hypothetical protein